MRIELGEKGVVHVLPGELGGGAHGSDVVFDRAERAGRGIRVIVVEGQRLGRAAEGVAEPAVLDRRQVLHQPQQVGAGRGHGPPQVVVAEALELPEHRVTVPVEGDPQALLLVAGERRMRPAE